MKLELLLIEEENEYEPPEVVAHAYRISPPRVTDSARNAMLLTQLAREAELNNISIAQNTQRDETETSKYKNREFINHLSRPSGFARGARPDYYGGAPGTEFFNVETITYITASIAAFTVFTRNVIGTAKDWRDLRAQRKIKARLGSKVIEVNDGDDLVALVEQELAASANIMKGRLPGTK